MQLQKFRLLYSTANNTRDFEQQEVNDDGDEDGDERERRERVCGK